MRDLTMSEILVVAGGGGVDDPAWDNYDNPTAPPTGGVGTDGTTIRTVKTVGCAAVAIAVGLIAESPAAGALALEACKTATQPSQQTPNNQSTQTTAQATCTSGAPHASSTNGPNGTTVTAGCSSGPGTATVTTGH